jgi:hypothetical protein
LGDVDDGPWWICASQMLTLEAKNRLEYRQKHSISANDAKKMFVWLDFEGVEFGSRRKESRKLLQRWQPAMIRVQTFVCMYCKCFLVDHREEIN